MHTLERFIVALLLQSLFMCSAAASQKNNESKNEELKNEPTAAAPVTAIRNLIAKGRFKEAETLLRNIEGNDYAKWCYMGIISLKRNDPRQAIERFGKAAKIDSNRPELFLFLAQAYFKTDQKERTLEALLKGEAAGKDHASYYLFRGHIEMSLSKHEAAFETLREGKGRFPEEAAFWRELAMVFIESGFYSTAVDYAKKYLEKVPDDRDGFLVIAQALREARQFEQAADVLENACLHFQQDAILLSALGYTYGQAGRHHAAARHLERAARLDSGYAFDAAEFYMLAGKWKEASVMNQRVPEKQRRLTQRLALFSKQGRLERAIVVGEQLKKAGMLTDKERYLLAFAYTQMGRNSHADELVRQITTAQWTSLAKRLSASAMSDE